MLRGPDKTVGRLSPPLAAVRGITPRILGSSSIEPHRSALSRTVVSLSTFSPWLCRQELSPFPHFPSSILSVSAFILLVMGDEHNEPTDADLMRRWQEGDLRAFEDLVRRWQAPVARLVGRLTQAESAGDLCQEVFLRVFRAGPRYRESGTFAAWIRRIAMSVARDAGRRQRPRGISPCADEPLDAFAPADALCRRETVEQVQQALEELPETLREVLVLRHYEGLNFEEIARLTSTPASTLKSRFAAALQRLRIRLGALGLTNDENLP